MHPQLLSDIEYCVRRAARDNRPPKRERLQIVAAQMRAKASKAALAQRRRRIQERLDPREQRMTRLALAHMEASPVMADRCDREALLLGIPRHAQD